MNAIRIRKTIDSETLHLPELKPFMGRPVEIVILDETPNANLLTPVITPGTGDWDAAARAAQELRNGGYDFEAWERRRDYDRQHASDNLP